MSMRLLALIISSAIALLIAERYIDGVSLSGSYIGLAISASVIGLVNFFLKPGLKLIFGPFIILSLGLFLVFINMLILWLSDIILPQIEFKNFSALFLTTLLLGIINFVISISLKKQ